MDCSIDVDELLTDEVMFHLREEDGKDSRLTQARLAAEEMGRLTPIVKEELRCAIQIRRLAAGKDELIVNFTNPPTHYQMSPEEQEKQRYRRERNKIAAQKSRRKRKKKEDEQNRELGRLESENVELKRQLKRLTDEIQLIHSGQR